MKGGTQNTMGESLQKLLGDVAQMQAMPDADMEFLSNLQQMIVGKIRDSLGGQQQGQQQPGQQGQPQQGQPDASQLQAALSGGPSGPSPMGGPMPGLSATGGAGNMDELARMLGGASRTG